MIIYKKNITFYRFLLFFLILGGIILLPFPVIISGDKIPSLWMVEGNSTVEVPHPRDIITRGLPGIFNVQWKLAAEMKHGFPMLSQSQTETPVVEIEVDSTPPTQDEVTLSKTGWKIDGVNTYDITIKASEPATGSGIREMRALINYQGDNNANKRGYFAWKESGYTWGIDNSTDRIPCKGVGFAVKYNGNSGTPIGYGKDYIKLLGCSTSVTGNQRTVTFTVLPSTNFGDFSENDVSFWARDYAMNKTGWKNYDLNFSSTVTNLLPDASFESGSLQAPFINAWRGIIEIDDSSARTGVHSLKHTANDEDSFTRPYRLSADAALTTSTGGQTFKLSAWAKATGDTPIQLRIFALDQQYEYVTNGLGAGNFTANTSWQRFSYTFTCPAGTQNVSVRLDNDGGAGSTVWWDDVILERVATVEFTSPTVQTVYPAKIYDLGTITNTKSVQSFNFTIPDKGSNLKITKVTGPVTVKIDPVLPIEAGVPLPYTGTVQVNPNRQEEQLLLSLPFSEGTGTTTADVSGKAHTGTIIGATWTSGKFGKALQFDGVDDYVDLGNDARFDITDAITLSAWVNPTVIQYGHIISKEGAYKLSILNDGKIVALFATDDSWGSNIVKSDIALPAGEWSHVAVTYLAATGDVVLYINGAVHGTAAKNGSIKPNAQEVIIGIRENEKLQFPFNGVIDEVEVLSRALSAEEIKSRNQNFYPFKAEVEFEYGGEMKGFFVAGKTTSFNEVITQIIPTTKSNITPPNNPSRLQKKADDPIQMFTLTFDDLGGEFFIEDFYNNYAGVQFHDSWFTLQQENDGGTGNFCNNPSGTFIATWEGADSAIINFNFDPELGLGIVNRIEFSYTSNSCSSNTPTSNPQQSGFILYDNFNGSGNELARVDFTEENQSGPDGCFFSTWISTGINFLGGAYSIKIFGQDSQVAIDDLTFYAQEINEFDVLEDSITVGEGIVTELSVRLVGIPANGSILVDVENLAGDPDIYVKGGSPTFVFNETNWNLYQTVEIEGLEDADRQNGSATLLVSRRGGTVNNPLGGTSGSWVLPTEVIANEQDDDVTLTMAVSPSSLPADSTGPQVGSQSDVDINDDLPFPIRAYPPAGFSFSSFQVSPGSVQLSTPTPIPGGFESIITSIPTGIDPAVTAVFTPITTVALTIYADPANGGTIQRDTIAPINSGDSLTVTVTPKAGFVFKEWTVNSGNVTITSEDSSTFTVTVFTDAVITANFQVESRLLVVATDPLSGDEIAIVDKRSPLLNLVGNLPPYPFPFTSILEAGSGTQSGQELEFSKLQNGDPFSYILKFYNIGEEPLTVNTVSIGSNDNAAFCLQSQTGQTGSCLQQEVSPDELPLAVFNEANRTISLPSNAPQLVLEFGGKPEFEFPDDPNLNPYSNYFAIIDATPESYPQEFSFEMIGNVQDTSGASPDDIKVRYSDPLLILNPQEAANGATIDFGTVPRNDKFFVLDLCNYSDEKPFYITKSEAHPQAGPVGFGFNVSGFPLEVAPGGASGHCERLEISLNIDPDAEEIVTYEAIFELGSNNNIQENFTFRVTVRVDPDSLEMYHLQDLFGTGVPTSSEEITRSPFPLITCVRPQEPGAVEQFVVSTNAGGGVNRLYEINQSLGVDVRNVGEIPVFILKQNLPNLIGPISGENLFSIQVNCIVPPGIYGADISFQYRLSGSTEPWREFLFRVVVQIYAQQAFQVKSGNGQEIEFEQDIPFPTTDTGDSVTESFTIEHTANPGTPDLVVDIDPNIGDGFTLLSSSTLTIKAGQSASFDVRLDAADGGDFEGMVLMKMGDPIFSVFRFDVQGNVRGIGPDLISLNETIKGQTSGITLFQGEQSIGVFTQVQNIGNQDAPASILRYYYSPDSQLDVTDIELASDAIIALTPDQTTSKQVSVSIPPSATLGEGNLLFVVDADGNVDEANEANNIFAFPITIEAPPQPQFPPLEVSGVSFNKAIFSPGADGIYRRTFYDITKAYIQIETTHNLPESQPPDEFLNWNVGGLPAYMDIVFIGGEDWNTNHAIIRLEFLSEAKLPLGVHNITLTATRDTDTHQGVPESITLQIKLTVEEFVAPTGVLATDGNYSDKVIINWNEASGATDYEVWRDINNTTSGAIKIKDSITGTSYDDNTVTPGTTYYYWVKAKNTDGTSGFSTSNSGYAAISIPQTPTGTSATDGTYTDKVRVTWNVVSNATSYEVWRDINSTTSGAIKIKDSTSGTSYDDTTATPGTTYYYGIKAKNSAGTSGFSTSNSGYAAISIPQPPTGISASDGTYTDKVRITWNAVNNATSYEVWRDINSTTNGAIKIKDSVAGTSYEDTSVTPGTTYYYWVKAKNSDGTSGFSTSNSGYAAIGIPQIPTGISATDGTYTDKVRVTWNAASNATSYEVWRDINSTTSGAIKIKDSVTGTSYDDTSVTPGTTYYYWVKARNAGGSSDYSAPDTGIAIIPTPDLTLQNGSANPSTLGRNASFTGSVDIVERITGDLPTGSFWTRFYYSDDATLNTTTDDLIGGYQKTSGPQTSPYRIILGGITIPADANLGTRYIFIQVDELNQVNETNEGNNVLSVPISVINRDPVANNDTAATTENTPVTINVKANDTDPDGDALTILNIDFVPPAHGSVFKQGGQIIYTPNTGYSGSDQFTYRIGDSHGGQDTAVVSVTVSGLPSGALGNLITVRYGSTTIPHNGSIDLGTARQYDPYLSRTIYVDNRTSQTLSLSISTSVSSAGIWLDGSPSLTVSGNGTAQFTLIAGTGNTGNKTTTITLADQNTTRDPFIFTADVRVDPAPPLNDLITVKSGTSIIANGGSVSLGTAEQGDPKPTKTIQVFNNTSQTLNLDLIRSSGTGILIKNNVTSLSIAAGSSGQFILEAGTANTGTKTVTVTLGDHDRTRVPFSFNATVTVSPPAAVSDMVTVKEGTNTIANEGNTNFDTVHQGDSPYPQKTLQVINNTSQTLSLSINTTGSTGIWIDGSLSLSVPGNGTVQFTLIAGTSNTGNKTTTITLKDQNTTRDPFRFTATVTVGPPLGLSELITLQEIGSAVILHGSTVNFGTVAGDSSYPKKTIRVTNTTTQALSLDLYDNSGAFWFKDNLTSLTIAAGGTAEFILIAGTGNTGNKTANITLEDKTNPDILRNSFSFIVKITVQ
jgi:Concanavalin A-like lectin/glucanases superfamily/Bacterial Ig domain/Divergent InlB B-repeat domain/CARDB/Fibronectin type III domain